ncbi:hypothetical protein MW887_011973 [Aspergillus wentii]|nr:hypothetical protein MW887_011973 [Aspergillus wentii]
METIQHDSELMTQYVAAVSVPNARRFVAVHDKNGQLMLFSLGTDSKLYVSSLDQSGNRVVRDLGLMLGFASSYTGHAFDVVQDAESKLYVAVAIAGSNASRSLLYLLRPFEPREVDLSSSSFNLKPFIMAGSGGDNPRVFEIFMAPAVGKNYPPVVFAFKEENYHSQDLASAAVTRSEDSYSWTKKDNVKLPENAEKIIAVQPLVMKYGSKTIPGHAVLYLIQGKKAITFYSINVPHELQVPLKQASDTTPSDPRALAALPNADGFTDLLVGGSGLYRFKAKGLAHPSCDKIADTGVFSSVKEIQVTRSNSKASLWAANTDNGIGYLMTDLDFQSPDPPVQVVPDQQGGYFAPFKATSSSCEAFVFANNVGNLSMLEQDAKSGVWKTIPLIQPSLDKTIQMQSYMTQIKPLNASGGPLINHPVILQASGDTSVIVNGRSVLATRKGISVRTDQTGLLTLTVPTDDISTHTFTVTDASKASTQSTQKFVDPAHKINQKLSKIQHKEDLNIDLGPGKGKLLDGTKLTPEQIEQVAGNIHQAMKTRDSIAQGKTPSSMALESCYGFNAEHIIQGAGSGGAWHWLEKQGDKIISFIVNGAKVLVQIGETIYQWVMKTVDQVGKVLSVILNKILDIGKKIIDWLGFIFNWKDITGTKDSIVNIVKDALEEGPILTDSLKGKSKHFFESMKKSVSDSRPSDHDMEKLGIKADDKTGSTDQSKSKTQNSMASNWAQYQVSSSISGEFIDADMTKFNHGGARDASTFLQMFSSDMTTPEESKAIGDLDQEFKNFEDKYHGKVTARQKKLVEEYQPQGKRSLDAKYAHEQTEKTFLTDCIDGVEKLTELLLNIIKTIINKFNGLLTTPINVPIFSSIYKTWISPGNELTLLDALALIIAIPATVIAKLVTGNKLPAIPRGRFAAMIKKMADGQSAKDADFNKFAAITGVATFGISLVLSIPESISPFAFEPGSDLYEELLVERPSPTASLVVLVDFSSGGGKVTTEHMLDAAVLIYTLHSIPKNKENPGYTLQMIGCAVEAGGRQDTQPEVELVAKIAKYVSYGIAVALMATKVGIHISHGNWTDIPFIGDV